MIAYITAWIKDIIFVVLFASFLELLLPSSSMQRFVRVIIGLFILLTILNPIIGFVEKQIATEQLPAMASHIDTSQTSNVLNTANSVAEKREQLACDLYVKDLSKQIRATVMTIDGVANANVIINLEPTNKRVGNIKNVVIYVEPGIGNNERKITKVTVGATNPKTAEDSNNLSTEVIDKITRIVTELYQLKARQVEVLRMN